MRALLDDAGFPLAGASYDAWGVPETPSIAPFGFTGELQRGNDVWLRARWYGAGRGGFGSRDAFEGFAETPYSMQYYPYGYSNPVSLRDPSGKVPSSPSGRAFKVIGDQRIDIGYIFGISGNLGSFTGQGAVGGEIVIDFYDFEIGFFTYRAVGIGIAGCTMIKNNLIMASGSAEGYYGLVTGWHNAPSVRLGVGMYAGRSWAFSGSLNIPRSPLGTINGQYFTSEGGGMWGVTAGLGISSDKLPFGGAYVGIDYTLVRKLVFHSSSSQGYPMPPTKQEKERFYWTAISLQPALVQAVAFKTLSDMNAKAWNDYYESVQRYHNEN